VQGSRGLGLRDRGLKVQSSGYGVYVLGLRVYGDGRPATTS